MSGAASAILFVIAAALMFLPLSANQSIKRHAASDRFAIAAQPHGYSEEDRGEHEPEP
jgi:hypothetical protein